MTEQTARSSSMEHNERTSLRFSVRGWTWKARAGAQERSEKQVQSLRLRIDGMGVRQLQEGRG